jgi:hypothetical protein
VRGTGVEGRDVDGVGGGGDEGEEVVGEETTVQGVWTMGEEI